jgi:hypothetical protein
MDIFSGIIWLVIIGAFIYPFAKTVIQKPPSPPPGRRPASGPRGLFESGGYEPAPEAGPDRRAARAEGRPTPQREELYPEAAPSIRRAPQPQQDTSRRAGHVDARSIRGQLRNPRSVRAAVILREVLDRPVSTR